MAAGYWNLPRAWMLWRVSTDELVPALEQFKAAAVQGEMDDMIAAQLAKIKRVNIQKQ